MGVKLLSRSGKPMSLRAKINWLVFLDIFIVLVLVLTVFSYIIVKIQFDEIGQRALTLAKVVADIPAIALALEKESDPSLIIQPLVEKIRAQTGAEFIVVGNMNLIRYSHPNPQNIGQIMVGDDNQKVLLGEYSITQAVGTLGLSVRGKAPIFGMDHGQRGVVSVGFLVDNIWQGIFSYLIIIAGIGLVGLAIGHLGAYLLSGHIKKQIFNMEPFEIAFLTQEQASILESIREGVVAVDIEGKITTCNQEAKRLLELDSSENVLGKPVSTVIANSRLPEVLASGISHFDQPMIIGNSLVIVNRLPVILRGKVIGAVSSFRDKMQLDQIDQRLADVGRYVDALRSQRHEFMNKLHTISGLITIQEYDLARQLIDRVNNEQQQVLDFFLANIRDSAVVGILLGKMHRAKELGVQLIINDHSRLQDQCSHRDLVLTILGNAIENSFEAFTDWNVKTRNPVITVYINDQSKQLIIKVIDSGPGISPEIKEHIFENGVSTKGTDRGFGLALLSGRIAYIGGALTVESGDEGAILEAVLPQ
ncbi:sensor histidine kinase [Desulfosporosinus sp. I2]|uniref:ATP-binding protein n=1 Tax=Desulfosporosinus sp. I2 TaxID=1617025 RepID=UPI00061E3448|nr:sensor histidine kinase [Desulfosporosinus sp. I2]KJR46580.1 sensor histidine kinase [Desulfosporosinus sp. I2]